MMDSHKKSSFQSDPIQAWSPFHLLCFFGGLCSSAEALLPLFFSFLIFISLVLSSFSVFFSSFFSFLSFDQRISCMDVLGVVGGQGDLMSKWAR